MADLRGNNSEFIPVLAVRCTSSCGAARTETFDHHEVDRYILAINSGTSRLVSAAYLKP